MSRNTFREILSNLHLADNTQTAEDRYYKVRVLFEKLNFNLKQYGSFVNEPLMKALSLTMENTAQNNLPEESPLGCPLEYWSGSDADVLLGLIEKCDVKAGSAVNLTICLPHSRC